MSITQGWDLIAAITQQSLNGLIASAFSHGDIPSTITQSLPLGPPLGTWNVTVNISPPTVDLNPAQAQGQSGMIGVTFPIVSGTIAAGNVPAVPIPAGSVEIVSVISYVTVDFSGGSTETLSLDFNNPLAIYNVIINAPGWSASNTAVLEATFKQFFQGLTPGSVNLGSVNVPSQASALAPVGAADFAIQTNSNPNLNTLLLLMLTASGTRPTGPGATNFSGSPPLLSSGQSAALYVSNRALIQEIIVPQLATSLQLQASAFSVQGSSTTPYTATFSGNQSITGEYDPQLTNLVVSVNNSQQVQAAYTVDAHPLFNAGGTYYIEVDGNLFIAIVLTGQAISFSTTADTGSGSLHASVVGWAIIVAAIIASFGGVAAFIAGVVAIVVPIVLSQLSFPITLPPPLLNSINHALGSFTWPGQTNFPLTSIQLPGDVVFIGTPTI